MEAKEFFKQAKNLCNSFPAGHCKNCPVNVGTDTNPRCMLNGNIITVRKEKIEKAIDIVERWTKERNHAKVTEL